MAQSDKVRFCLWLVMKLLDRKKMTRKQILKEWMCEVNQKGGFVPDVKTFYNYVKDCKKVTNFDIGCDKSYYYYYLKNVPHTGASEWLFKSFDINQMATNINYFKIKDRILYPNLPKGGEHLETISRAMCNNQKLNVVHQKYGHEKKEYILCPYYLKPYKGHWYLIAAKEDNQIHSFALDRVVELKVLEDQTFVMDNHFDANEYFRNTYGVYHQDSPPEEVVLRVTGKAVNYLRDQPLHHSQEEVVIDDDTSHFSYTLVPTPDFYWGVLSRGTDLEILSPHYVRKYMSSIVETLYKRYHTQDLFT